MWQFASGHILHAKADALVNPVNCHGKMGAGLAKEFRKAFPHMHSDYILRYHSFRPGNAYVYHSPFWGSPSIIYATTKDHWMHHSSTKIIDGCLFNLVELANREDFNVVAIPKLGCGLGGLCWDDVKKLYDQYLYRSRITFQVYG